MRPVRARREALGEYLRGALWVMPGAAVVLALVTGTVLSRVRISPTSPLHSLAFAGTADDARQVLIAIASTIVTVIALVLGLTIVALQVASTQFSPRLLRNFLRDRPNQVVLAMFVATFAYSTAGLYTVRTTAASSATDFPRIAITGAIVLVFVSLGSLVYFVHHMAHSIQIDTVMTSVAQITARGITARPRSSPHDERTALVPPAGSIRLMATRSGYVQTVHPALLVEAALRQDAVIGIVPRVGDHVVADVSPLSLAWSRSGGPPEDARALTRVLRHAVQIGAERTLQQDAAFGLRQLVDIALRALSPAVNDPYTAVQALDRLSTLISLLGTRKLGDETRYDRDGRERVIAPGPSFADYLDLACGQIRRFGAGEPAVSVALLRLLTTASTSVTDSRRQAEITDQARLVLADADSRIAQPADREPVRALAVGLIPPPPPGDHA